MYSIWIVYKVLTFAYAIFILLNVCNALEMQEGASYILFF